MPYVTLAQMKAALPAEITDQLLDDAGSGVADPNNWPAISARVTEEIEGKVGQRYTLPITHATGLQLLGQFAFVLAAELIYQRRGYFDDTNPWSARAVAIRGDADQKGQLDKIASGEQPLFAAAPSAAPAGAAFVESSRLTPTRPAGSDRGHMMC